MLEDNYDFKSFKVSQNLNIYLFFILLITILAKLVNEKLINTQSKISIPKEAHSIFNDALGEIVLLNQ